MCVRLTLSAHFVLLSVSWYNGVLCLYSKMQRRYVIHWNYLNLKKRILQHNQGIKTPIQKGRRPVKLAYWEKFNTRLEAAEREEQIKGLTREKKERLIESLH